MYLILLSNCILLCNLYFVILVKLVLPSLEGLVMWASDEWICDSVVHVHWVSGLSRLGVILNYN